MQLIAGACSRQPIQSLVRRISRDLNEVRELQFVVCTRSPTGIWKKPSYSKDARQARGRPVSIEAVLTSNRAKEAEMGIVGDQHERDRDLHSLVYLIRRGDLQGSSIAGIAAQPSTGSEIIKVERTMVNDIRM